MGMGVKKIFAGPLIMKPMTGDKRNVHRYEHA